jgi:hypothetical protein
MKQKEGKHNFRGRMGGKYVLWTILRTMLGWKIGCGIASNKQLVVVTKKPDLKLESFNFK